jgi:hypothetical protein
MGRIEETHSTGVAGCKRGDPTFYFFDVVGGLIFEKQKDFERTG